MTELDWGEAYEFFEEHIEYVNQPQQEAIDYLDDAEEDVFAYLEVDENQFEITAGIEIEDSEIPQIQMKGELAEEYEVP